MESLFFDEEEDKWFTLPGRYYYTSAADDLLDLGDEEAERYDPQVARASGCALLAVPAKAAKLIAPQNA